MFTMINIPLDKAQLKTNRLNPLHWCPFPPTQLVYFCHILSAFLAKHGSLFFCMFLCMNHNMMLYIHKTEQEEVPIQHYMIRLESSSKMIDFLQPVWHQIYNM
ncbi:MAG: hypothetical protein BLM47_09410 [Candidatus Reconcilbacillus cellulovorans]|uniref:Uncharacterized protein n=1 Tax=Candidatus Reconcilbacillus cellulovorans TaxID=1906605 RepID=A0A2A6DZ03_9BACL|nr:MAG: hypothetical protein BLM47_09410 [Candidatus Reconcilbacillus cellulovorans]